MIIRSTKKQLLTGTSALALAAAVTAVSMPTQAFAAWGTITTPTVAAQTAANNSEALVIDGTGANTGDLAVPGAIAVVNTNKTTTTIAVNAADTSHGISSTGNFSAISITGTGTLTSLTNTKGLITGAGLDAAHATVILNGAAAATTITNTANGIISNTGAAGVAIDIGATAALTPTIVNAGSIISTGSATSDAIDVESKAGASLTLTNTGIITAGANGNAIKIGDLSVATITQTSGTITGAINLGAGTTGASTLAVNGGTIAGNVTMGLAADTLTLGGGQINGTITGPGAVASTGNYVTNGAIGSGTGVTSLTITDSKTFNTATHNDAITATAITVGTGANGATLTLGTGVVTGTVDSSTNGKGTINFNGSNTLGVGTTIGATAGFATINITDGKTVDDSVNNNSIKATNIVLGTAGAGGAVLKLGTGLVTGAIDGDANGNGTVAFAGSQTNAAVIGATHGLAAITVADGAAVVLNANAAATTTTVGAGASGTLTLNAGKTLTGNVVLANGSTLNQVTTGIITGTVNGSAAGKGTYNIKTAGAFATNNAIGGTNGLLAFTTADAVTSTLAHNITATTTTFGGGASGTEAQSAGTITATTSTVGVGNTFTQTGTGKIAGNLVINDTGTFVLNGGSGVTGTINGGAAGKGIFTLTSAFTTPAIVGGGAALATVNVNNGGALTLGANLSATTVNVIAGGTLNLGNNAANVLTTTNLNDTGTGIINIGTKAHTGVGTLTTNTNTDVIGVNINSGALNDSGKLTATTVTYTAAPRVLVDVSKSTSFIATGQTYNVLVGTGADAAPTAVTTTGSNFLTFARDAGFAANTLTLIATRAATYQSVATTGNDKSVGTALTTLGLNADPNISAFQGRLDGTTTVAQVDTALKEVSPQVNASGVQAVINTTGLSMDVVGTRLSQLRAGIDTSSNGMAAGGAVADKGLWIQGFGTTATQDLRSGVDGYDANTLGVAVGGDMAVADNTRAGISFSYGHTTVDSNGVAIQNTDIDTYQGNLYGSYNMGAWYTEALLGAAYQDYNTDRTITAPSVIANGSYSGETYTARMGSGYRFAAGNGFDLTPNATLTYYYNHVGGYTETGAGGLDLNVGSNNTQALIGRFGADLGYSFQNSNMMIRPVVRAAYMYDFIGDQVSTNAFFTGGGGTFNVKDASPARNAFDVGASLNVARTDNISFSADYDFEGKSGYDSHSGMLRARINF